jgi:hypothetical protein
MIVKLVEVQCWEFESLLGAVPCCKGVDLAKDIVIAIAEIIDNDDVVSSFEKLKRGM